MNYISRRINPYILLKGHSSKHSVTFKSPKLSINTGIKIFIYKQIIFSTVFFASINSWLILVKSFLIHFWRNQVSRFIKGAFISLQKTKTRFNLLAMSLSLLNRHDYPIRNYIFCIYCALLTFSETKKYILWFQENDQAKLCDQLRVIQHIHFSSFITKRKSASFQKI